MTRRLTISVEEAAELLGISRGLAYALVRREELPSIRLGRRLVVPVVALRRLMAAFDDDPGAVIDIRDQDDAALKAVQP